MQQLLSIVEKILDMEQANLPYIRLLNWRFLKNLPLVIGA